MLLFFFFPVSCSQILGFNRRNQMFSAKLFCHLLSTKQTDNVRSWQLKTVDHSAAHSIQELVEGNWEQNGRHGMSYLWSSCTNCTLHSSDWSIWIRLQRLSPTAHKGPGEIHTGRTTVEIQAIKIISRSKCSHNPEIHGADAHFSWHCF